MGWFKKNEETPKPQRINFSPKKIIERLRRSNTKWYESDIVLKKDGKQIGVFPMTIQAYSKQHLKEKVKENLTLEATNIRVKKSK